MPGSTSPSLAFNPSASGTRTTAPITGPHRVELVAGEMPGAAREAVGAAIAIRDLLHRTPIPCHSNLTRALAAERDLPLEEAEVHVHDVMNVFMCTGYTRDTHQLLAS